MPPFGRPVLKGQRIFIGSHYPPYLLHPDEPEHYDNLGPEGRDWLLSMLEEFDIEALFCGHVHQYWFHRYGRTRCHLLPSTAFTRQDYSEMFHVASGDEFGRNDYGLLAHWAGSKQAAGFDKYLLRLAFDESVESAVEFAASQYAATGKQAVIQLRVAENNPAASLEDDSWLCRRLARALLYGHANPACEFFCDTFADNDRGYFPRVGVVDRRYNPRPGMRLIQQINTLLSRSTIDDAPRAESAEHHLKFSLNVSDENYRIYIPRDDFDSNQLPNEQMIAGDPVSGRHYLNLASTNPHHPETISDWQSALTGNFPFALLD